MIWRTHSVMDSQVSRYHEVYAHWQHDLEGFWCEAAQEIDWIEPAKRVFDPNTGVYGRWFVGGVCNLFVLAVSNVCYIVFNFLNLNAGC
jgi:propionyl-CoA synthetase